MRISAREIELSALIMQLDSVNGYRVRQARQLHALLDDALAIIEEQKKAIQALADRVEIAESDFRDFLEDNCPTYVNRV